MDLAERGRFDLPPSVQAANEEYRSKIDTVATFLDEACELGLQVHGHPAGLYEGYREWCGRNGRMPTAQTAFSPRVRQLLRHEIAAGQIEEGKFGAKAVRGWKGLRIRA